jgi:hypothetical protein
MNWSQRYAKDDDCTLCHNAGWILDAKPDKHPTTLELMPCILPDCKHSGRPVANLSLFAEWGNPVFHPTNKNAVMSLEQINNNA